MQTSIRRARLGVVATALALAATLIWPAVGGATASSNYPVTGYLTSAVAAAASHPDAPAAGMNVPCTLTKAHPYPVILINGTFTVMSDDWAGLAPVLANDGYCVAGLNTGGTPGNLVQATGPIATSAQQVATFIDATLKKYHVTKVDLVGHSQGGMLAEYVAKVLGYGSKINAIVGLSPSTHGVTVSGFVPIAESFPGAVDVINAGCPACVDQAAGSAALKPLDTGAITVPGPKYTVIETVYETLVTPVGSAFINEHGVTNEYVQSFCPNDTIDHAGLPYDNTATRFVLNALSPSTARSPNCFLAYPAPEVQQ